jgi:hypothetical protein
VSRFPVAAAVLGVVLGAARPALAGDALPAAPPPAATAGPNVRAALAVGAFTMLVPGILGGSRAALDGSPGQKAAGLLVASGGFALAPIFSHMITREWARAAAFGALPIATTIAATAFISQRPDAVYDGTSETRTAFAVLLGAGMLDAVIGLVDTALAGERARARAAPRRAHFVVPTFGPGSVGLAFGGLL